MAAVALRDGVGTIVTVGVDTQADARVAVALDQTGRKLAVVSVPVTSVGYRRLLVWACGLGDVDRFGLQGTSCYGSGLTRFPCHAGIEVVEVIGRSGGTGG